MNTQCNTPIGQSVRIASPGRKIKASPNPSEGGGLPPLRGGLGKGLFSTGRHIPDGMLTISGKMLNRYKK
jgi:hypothetical protein